MANSVTARFNDDCKVFVSMSDDTTVEKAVIIDAEGNETDIGGGGSSDFSTAEVTINVTTEGSPTLVYKTFASDIEYPETASPYYASFEDFTGNIILYKNKAIIGLDSITAQDSDNNNYIAATNPTPTTSGNATYDADNSIFIITGDCTINVKIAII